MSAQHFKTIGLMWSQPTALETSKLDKTLYTSLFVKVSELNVSSTVARELVGGNWKQLSVNVELKYSLNSFALWCGSYTITLSWRMCWVSNLVCERLLR